MEADQRARPWRSRRGCRRRRARAWKPAARPLGLADELGVGIGSAESSAASPAAVASGFPDSVPAWYTGAERGEVVHEVGPAAEGADVEPAADDLAEAGQVGA